MNETPSHFDQNELSDDDLAILHAFEDAEELVVKSPVSDVSTQELPPLDQAPTSQFASPSSSLQPADSDISDDMLVLFITEADGDIAVMRQALRQLEQDDSADSANLGMLQRTAHKLKGTAGAVGYEHLSTIAYHIELFVKLVQSGAITRLTGLAALLQAVQALEATLYSVASSGQENSAPLTELEAACNALNVDVRASENISSLASAKVEVFPKDRVATTSPPDHGENVVDQSAGETAALATILPGGQVTRAASIPPVQVDPRHLEQLMLHIEQLAEQRASLENAQAQVEAAQQELHAAQVRLLYLETLLSPVSPALKISNSGGDTEPPMSSLVARILNEAVRRTGHVHRHKSKSLPQSARSQNTQGTLHWDELEIEPYKDDELLARSLSEAIADVATASAQLRMALEQLSRALQKHMTQTGIVRSNALLLLPHFQEAVKGLLVRVARQHVVVPFAHVQRIDYKKSTEYEPLYVLNTLLGFPTEQVSTETARPLLILRQSNVAVQVDEVIREVEVVMKPLPAHLQRPGIAGAASDGRGNVLLMLDVPALVMRSSSPQQVSEIETAHSNRLPSQKRPTVLIADDSVYIRQSVLQILDHAGYDGVEAHNGIEALEQLLAHSIDVLLLDIEMPNLNGYDLLTIIRANPQFARLKVVMLTSRSSEKHQRRARELRVDAYLTKPCPQDTLLATLARCSRTN